MKWSTILVAADLIALALSVVIVWGLVFWVFRTRRQEALPTQVPGWTTTTILLPSPTATRPGTPNPTPSPTVTPTAVEVTYVVQRGDTLFGIALRFGVAIDALMKANDIADRNTIFAGMELFIPLAGVIPT